MKKETLIAIGVLAVLSIGLLVLMQGSNNEPEPIGYTIPKLADADKIEIAENGTTITLAKEGDGWRIKHPIDYPVAETASTALNTLLSRPIGMDMDYATDAAAKYELGDTAATVTIYVGADAKASFKVGKEITVQPTNVKRVFIQPTDAKRIYRAQAGLRSELIKKLDDWRNKKLFSFEEADITTIDIKSIIAEIRDEFFTEVVCNYAFLSKLIDPKKNYIDLFRGQEGPEIQQTKFKMKNVKLILIVNGLKFFE